MVRRLHLPMLKPEDVIPHLARKELHWKAGYSAQELATAWFRAGNGFPSAVRAALGSAPEYASAELVDAHFECEVDLGTAGENSHTDILVIAGLGSELALIAVEGKVEETFDKTVAKWNNSSGKQTRLEGLCGTLNLDPEHCGEIRYQLLHRTASAVYEAKRYRSQHAMMLVHSFSSRRSHFDDFAAFAAAMGIPVPGPGVCSPAKECEGVHVRLCWVADECS